MDVPTGVVGSAAPTGMVNSKSGHVGPLGWTTRRACKIPGGEPAKGADPTATSSAAPSPHGVVTWVDPVDDCRAGSVGPKGDAPGESVHIKLCTVA